MLILVPVNKNIIVGQSVGSSQDAFSKIDCFIHFTHVFRKCTLKPSPSQEICLKKTDVPAAREPLGSGKAPGYDHIGIAIDTR
ncbi:hypothetical protein DSO57_1036821 [Entomophthora muscae]|uniref:Uncharacterized protein n=1 Tax=Entomophthora muscae TaxID=34485 RepID=A0ACC2U8S4_9FUNG|nr:hypothetical protein DSO57_1036821 [Entomophthora muscae]